MAARNAPILRHVSRREIAVSRPIWLATGGMYALLALGIAGIAIVVPDVWSVRLAVVLALESLISIVFLRSEPPPIGSIGNHFVIASVWIMTTLGMWAFQPAGSAAIGAAIFIGPFTAVRLQDRRQIAAHIGGACLALWSVALGGTLWNVVDWPTSIACFEIAAGAVILCFSCMVVLEAAEAQGDELERLVRRDPLTGVGNRRLLNETLAEELRRHERTQRPLSLITLDLNGFGHINEALGHSAGDAALRAIAEALTGVVERRDTVVRPSGDEFVLILPETNPDGAHRTVNAVRTALAKIPLETEHGDAPPDLKVTASAGIASFPEDAIDVHVLLHVADERLRAEKHRLAGEAALAKRQAAATTEQHAGEPTADQATGAPALRRTSQQ